jgi:predicted ester cyclase
VSPHIIYHARGEDVTGIENFKKWVSTDRSLFPDIRFTIVDNISEFNKVATSWIVEATHRREFRGIRATHKKFKTVGFNIFHFEGNKIKEVWIVIDGLTPALQLGVVKTVSSETLVLKFLTLPFWNQTILAEERIKEIKEGIVSNGLRIIENQDEIIKEIKRKNNSANKLSICSTLGGMQMGYNHLFDSYKNLVDK